MAKTMYNTDLQYILSLTHYHILLFGKENDAKNSVGHPVFNHCFLGKMALICEKTTPFNNYRPQIVNCI